MVTKHGTIRYVRYNFIMCNSNMSKNIVTLKFGPEVTQGKWYRSVDYVPCGFPLVYYSNFVPKTHHFRDIRLVSIP